MFRKNVAGQFIHFQGVSATTGGILTGITWTVRRCIDGTFAAATGTAGEDGTTGWYKFALSQADTNGNNIGFNFTGTGAIPQTVNIVTTAADPTDAVRLGLTALPNAAADAAGGLPISDAGGLDLDTKLANTNEITVARMGALTDWINGGRLDLILDIIAADTTTDIPALIATLQAFVDTEVASILAAVDTEVAAILADTNDLQTQIGVAGAGLTAINLPDQTMNITGDITGNLSGSVGSVTGLTASNLDATVSSRATQTSVDDLPTNTELAIALGTADDATLAAIAALNNLSQADVRTAIGLGSANLDTQLGDLPTNAELATALGTADDAVLAAIAALNNISADNVLDEVVDGLLTLRESIRLHNSALAGKLSGAATTTVVIRDIADTKDRVTATVDADGNRSAVVLDVS